jgi:hypothetical protein
MDGITICDRNVGRSLAVPVEPDLFLCRSRQRLHRLDFLDDNLDNRSVPGMSCF